MVESKHSRETDADQQGSAGIDGLMAGLPPLLLGTYTPKIDAKRSEEHTSELQSQR